MQRPSRKQLLAGGALGFLGGAALIFYATAGFLDSDALRFFDAHTPGSPYVAVLFSGDMGLRVGMGGYIAAALNRVGVPVLGISSSTEFATRKSRNDVDTLVARSIDAATQRTGAQQVILIGQSFGADIMRVGLAHLPRQQRARVAAVVLVVPGETAFFHADPTGLTYRGPPDAGPAEAARIDWASILCIRGSDETDSLCPLLRGANVRSVSLPGGHLLRRDHALLTHTIVSALAPLIGQARP